MAPLTHRKALILLIFSHLSIDLYGSFLAPLQPFLIQKHSLSLTQAGLLVSIFSISASLLQPLYGFWADRIGKRFFVILAPVLAASFMSLLTRAENYFLLMACLVLAGVGIAAFHPQASSLSHAVSGNRKGLGMSLFISGGNIGTALGPLYIMFFVNRFGLESAVYAAVPGLLLSLALLMYCPEMPRQETKIRFSTIRDDIKRYAGPLSTLYAIVVFRTFVQLSFITFIPVLLKQMELPPLLIGVGVTCFTGFGALGGLTGGFLFDRIGGRNLFLISSITAPLFLFLAVTVQNIILTVLFTAIAGFLLMMTIPISVLMGQSIVPNAISTVSSLMMGFGWGVGGMLVPLAGRYADATSIPETLRVVALLPLLYTVLAWRLPGKKTLVQTVS